MISKFVDLVSTSNVGKNDIVVEGEPYHIIAMMTKVNWHIARYVPTSILKTDDYYEFYSFLESDGWVCLPVIDKEFIESFFKETNNE